MAPDPLNPDHRVRGGRTEVSRFRWPTGEVQNVTPAAAREAPSIGANRTQPSRFSPVNPHVLYYAANVLFKTTDGGNTWQTISQDLTRRTPGVPESLGSMADAGPEAESQRGVIYSLAPSFKHEHDSMGGNRRRTDLDDPRWREELEATSLRRK